MKTIAIKIGSGVLLTQRNKLDEFRIAHIADQIVSLRDKGLGTILVISGAVACGANVVDFSGENDGLRCLAAGIGQAYLISIFQQIFLKKGLQIAQILVTKNLCFDEDKEKFKKLLQKYLEVGVIPIINENDVIDLNSFGGNDLLATEVATMLNVDQLLILSTMAGSTYGVGGGETKKKALEILKKRNIPASIVDGKAQNIILQNIL